MTTKTVTIFRYLDDLDCFVVSPTYLQMAADLGLVEWNPVVWIGRLFTLDNDSGEHWFDNWELRAAKRAEAERLGIAEDDLLIIDPERLADGRDGPCHTAAIRKRFWTDVLRSLALSQELIFEEARALNIQRAGHQSENYIGDLEQRIDRWRSTAI